MKYLQVLCVCVQLFFMTPLFSQGNGEDGALIIPVGTTTINITKSDVSSTAGSGQAVVNVTSVSGFAATNLVLVIQMLGTNVGVWEIKTISSIAGNAITMTANLTNTYTKSGSASLAQVIKIPQYTNVTVGASRTLTASAWDGTTGGILIFYANGTLTVDGTISMSGKGYRGGSGATGVSGPSPAGAGGAGGASPCGNGSDGTVVGAGAVGSTGCDNCAGISRGGRGGLRSVQAGSSGTAGEGPGGGSGGGATGAVGGDNFSSCNTSACTLMQMGSGGGGGKAGNVSIAGGGGGGGGGNGSPGIAGNPGASSGAGGNGGNGGAGGGIIRIHCNVFAGAGVVSTNGSNGGNGTTGGNGGNGGTGGAGGDNNPHYGGGGGGGQAANGSEGGGAGAFGSGGLNYIKNASMPYTGAQTSVRGNHGSGGSGGIGSGATGQAGPCNYSTAGSAGSAGVTGQSALDPAGGGSGEVILPIRLIRFEAAETGKAALLSWATATETNNDYFTIEKSKNTKDWLQVNDIKGAGNSSVTKLYSSVDHEPYNGLSFYRLKQIDYNGAFSFSHIVSVNFNLSDETIFNVYPTLSLGSFDFSFAGKKDKQVIVVVRNVLGQEFYSKGFILGDDVFVQSVDLSGILAPGIYMVIASSNDRVFAKRIIID